MAKLVYNFRLKVKHKEYMFNSVASKIGREVSVFYLFHTFSTGNTNSGVRNTHFTTNNMHAIDTCRQHNKITSNLRTMKLSYLIKKKTVFDFFIL